MSAEFVPLDHQPRLEVDKLIRRDAPDEEAVPMDVVFVGGGPAGLSGAIELARLVKLDNDGGGGIGEVEIAVLEKGAELGHHSLSGAVINPRAMRELFPDLADEDFPFRRKVEKESVYKLSKSGSIRLPTPPTMKNHGNYVVSLSEMTRWLGEQAEGLGVNVFANFPVQNLLVDGDQVVGVRTVPAGLDKDGSEGSSFEPSMDITARVTALAEGSRGPLTQAYLEWQNIHSPNPQIYALGVKEIWETKQPLDQIIHTLGWPLPSDAFGGSWMYPLEDNLVSIGLVVGLDYRNANLDVHVLLQKMKQHPLFKPYLDGGRLDEWGAKTIPEGGYYSLPSRRTGDGVVVLGDCAGLVDVPSLKGIHYAMQSGIYAARAIFAGLKADDVSQSKLAHYDQLVDDSYIVRDMKKTRNMRLAFKSGFFMGGFKAAMMTFSGGKLFGGKIDIEEDAAEAKVAGPEDEFVPDGELTFSKVDAVFKSGNATRDTVPQHLEIGEDVPEHVAKMYEHMCPAAVYEVQDKQLVVNAPNCVDCKATDVIGPRWEPREGGSGPRYRRM